MLCCQALGHWGVQPGTWAVGKAAGSLLHPRSMGEEGDPGNAAEMGEGSALPEGLKPRVSRPFHTFVSPSVIKEVK